MNVPGACVAAFDLRPEQAHRLRRRQDVAALEKAVDHGLAHRKPAQNERAMRDGLVARDLRDAGKARSGGRRPERPGAAVAICAAPGHGDSSYHAGCRRTMRVRQFFRVVPRHGPGPESMARMKGSDEKWLIDGARGACGRPVSARPRPTRSDVPPTRDGPGRFFRPQTAFRQARPDVCFPFDRGKGERISAPRS